jgi:hypothetical protein
MAPPQVPPCLPLIHRVRQAVLLGYRQDGDRPPTVKDAGGLAIKPGDNGYLLDNRYIKGRPALLAGRTGSGNERWQCLATSAHDQRSLAAR